MQNPPSSPAAIRVLKHPKILKEVPAMPLNILITPEKRLILGVLPSSPRAPRTSTRGPRASRAPSRGRRRRRRFRVSLKLEDWRAHRNTSQRPLLCLKVVHALARTALIGRPLGRLAKIRGTIMSWLSTVCISRVCGCTPLSTVCSHPQDRFQLLGRNRHHRWLAVASFAECQWQGAICGSGCAAYS